MLDRKPKPQEPPRIKIPEQKPQMVPVPDKRKRFPVEEPNKTPTTLLGVQRRVFLINSKGEGVRVTDEGIKIGDFGVYTGTMSDIPRSGEHLISPNHKYKAEVTAVVHELDLTKNRPQRIYLILKV